MGTTPADTEKLLIHDPIAREWTDAFQPETGRPERECIRRCEVDPHIAGVNALASLP